MQKEKQKAKRILLVDDDVDLLMLLERKLHRSGYIIEAAASLPEAEYVLSLFRPDVVLLDINVAGEDGRRLCWEIKHSERNSKTKVILMSGYNYSISGPLSFGADDYVAKPFDSEYLVNKIARLLTEQPVPEPLLVFGLPKEVRRSHEQSAIGNKSKAMSSWQ